MADFLSTYPLGLWFVLLATGMVIGVLAGLLGVGGGIVAVPVLLELFASIGIDERTGVVLAIGTAHVSILLASLTAASAHWRAGTIDRPLVRAWLPALMAGTLIGLLAGPFVPPRTLTTVFAVIAGALAFKMAVGDRLVIAQKMPSGAPGQILPALVGVLASAVGVGAGTLSTPALSLLSFPLRRGIGAGALFNLVVALPAAATFLSLGWGAPGRPFDAVGEVSLFCVAALSLPALFVAPLAARWSVTAPVALLRRLFALCLAVIAARLLLRL